MVVRSSVLFIVFTFFRSSGVVIRAARVGQPNFSSDMLRFEAPHGQLFGTSHSTLAPRLPILALHSLLKHCLIRARLYMSTSPQIHTPRRNMYSRRSDHTLRRLFHTGVPLARSRISIVSLRGWARSRLKPRRSQKLGLMSEVNDSFPFIVIKCILSESEKRGWFVLRIGNSSKKVIFDL